MGRKSTKPQLRAVVYEYGNFTIEQRDKPDKWAVVHDGFVLNNQLVFEYEPQPSSRSEAFIKRTRFSMGEALKLAKQAHKRDYP